MSRDVRTARIREASHPPNDRSIDRLFHRGSRLPKTSELDQQSEWSLRHGAHGEPKQGEILKKNPPGPGRKCVLKPVCVSPNTTTTSSSSGTSLTSPVCFPRRPPAARYSSSHERNGAAAADCGVYGRWSCRFLLHLSVPEGLQTLCTEFGGVAQNAKWTLQPRACVRVRGQSDPMASCPSARP